MGDTKEETVSGNAKPRSSTPPRRRPATETADNETKKEEKKEVEEEKEFGGTIGVCFIMISSHILMLGMAASLFGTDWRVFMPTQRSVTWFLCYHASQWLFARFMPGVFVKGQTELGYHCNAYSTFYATLTGALVLHFTGVFDLTHLPLEYPAFLTTAMVIGNIYSVIIHLYYAKGLGQLSDPYEFFIGIGLHPRIGIVDIKMVAETRISWTLLLLITIGSYIQATRRYGSMANPAAFMVLAHTLYGNACAKGEHFIPYTWDITTEKFGWMLCWWNLAGVPLLYCYQSVYLAMTPRSALLLPPGPPSVVYYTVITALLLVAYWIWDEANYHKCYFKMEQRGEVIQRNLFPTFRHVKDPKYIKCDRGMLLIDGWYGLARKIHYTADTSMALLWGLCCGFGSFLPYVYFIFFTAMITHRCARDEARCQAKYGDTWKKYLKAVPYRFIPGVY